MRGRFVRVLVIVALLTGMFYTSLLITKRAYAQSAVYPFTAERWVYSYGTSPSGTLVLKEKTIVDENGSVVELRSTLTQPDKYFVRTISRTDGVVAKVIDELRVVSSGYDPETDHLKHRGLRAKAGCVIAGRDEQLLRHDPLLGYEAIVFQAVRPRNVRITEWRIPELGCFALRRTSEKTQPDGTFKLVSEYKPMSAQTGMYDKTLFEIPADYSELKPSELEKRMNEFLRIQLPAVPDHWSRMDKEYEQRKRAIH